MSTIAMKEWNLPHAPRSLFLPASIPLRTKIVTHPRTTSGRVSKPKTSSTFHDTANPRTNADGEWAWLAGGRQGGSLGGYNSIVDDKGVIYCQYLDWETWHAGVNTGNLYSWGTELAFGGSVVWTVALENVCAWHGALLEMGDLNPVTAFIWHRFWTGKYCPGQIFSRGLEAVVIAKVKEYWRMSRNARDGVVDVPSEVQWAKPIPPRIHGQIWDGLYDVTINGVKFEAQKMVAKTTTNLNRRQYASAESLPTGPTIPSGTEIKLLGWVAGELVDGISEWWVDEEGNRLWAGGIGAEPKQDPEYGQNPEDLPGVIPINGRLYYPLYDEDTGRLGRKIDVFRDGNLHKWAETTSDVVGQVKAGEERVFRYWTRGEELPLTFKDGTEAMEGIWFAEDLYAGPRMWSGLASERPD